MSMRWKLSMCAIHAAGAAHHHTQLGGIRLVTPPEASNHVACLYRTHWNRWH